MRNEIETIRAELHNMGVKDQVLAGITDLETLRAVHRHELQHVRASYMARVDRMTSEQVYAELMDMAA
jgi:hypothetical protein